MVNGRKRKRCQKKTEVEERRPSGELNASKKEMPRSVIVCAGNGMAGRSAEKIRDNVGGRDKQNRKREKRVPFSLKL